MFYLYTLAFSFSQKYFIQTSMQRGSGFKKVGNWEPDKIYFRVMLIMCVKIKEIKVA